MLDSIVYSGVSAPPEILTSTPLQKGRGGHWTFRLFRAFRAPLPKTPAGFSEPPDAPTDAPLTLATLTFLLIIFTPWIISDI